MGLPIPLQQYLVRSSPAPTPTSARRLRSSVVLVWSLLGSIGITFLANIKLLPPTRFNDLSEDHWLLLPPIDAPTARNRTTPAAKLQPSAVVLSSSSANSPPRHEQTTDRLPRILAIYFPQYHRDPINDKNWGENFTDWVSLRASPKLNKAGFEIPRPTELGYYDLSETEPRKQQGQLAKEYGIDGFIYHHYWFYDRTHPGPNLAAPLLNMLEDGHPDVPFFLNWCATKWINVWMGKAIFQTIPTNKNRAITLQEQFFEPSRDEIKEHYEWLSRFFHHENYIRIKNQPVMLLYIYDERAIPILQELRTLAKNDGFNGIYWIIGRNAAPDELFVPLNLTRKTTQIMKKKTQTLDMFPLDEVFNQSMTYPYPLPWLTNTYTIPEWCQQGQQREVAAPQTRQEVTGLLTAFDNTPRRNYQEATLYGADTPERILARFGVNLRTALYYNTCCQSQTEDRFVAINAWNESGGGYGVGT